MAIEKRKYLQVMLEKYIEQIELNPEDSTIPYKKIIVREKKSETTEAFKEFDKALKLNPEDAAVYYNRGLAYQKRDDIDEAIAEDCYAHSLAALNPLLCHN